MGKVSTILFGVVAILVLMETFAKPKPDDKYTTAYDHTDIDAILGSKRLLIGYVKCLLDNGNCNPDGVELKKNLREALETDCEKCSDVQSKNAFKVLVHLRQKEPEILNQLKAKYDPNGDFEKRLCKRLEAGEIDTHYRCKKA